MRRLTLAALLVALTAGPAAATPPMWIVRDQDSTLVLFGAFHLLPAGQDWKPPELDAAIAKADDIWFELPLDAAARLASSQLVVQRGAMPKGKSLYDLLDRDTRRQLRRVARSLRVPPGGLARLQPWLAEATLSAAFRAKQGLREEHGVEAVVLRLAPPTAEFKAFETPEKQIALWADVPQPAQIAWLKDTLNEIEKDPGAAGRAMAAWKAGDVDALSQLVVDPMRKVSPGFYRGMIQSRNIAWTRQIAARLAGSGTTVVVVGAAHLVGADSVPALLRARGIKVEGP